MPTERRTTQPEIQRVTLPLDCILRPEEVNAHALEAAKLDEEVFDEKEAASSRSKASKALCDDLVRQRGEHLRKVRTGREERKVTCERVYDFAENAVRTIRLDTGEEVDNRAMTYEERQQHLFEVPRAADDPMEREGADRGQLRNEQSDFERNQIEAADSAGGGTDGSQASGDHEG